MAMKRWATQLAKDLLGMHTVDEDLQENDDVEIVIPEGYTLVKETNDDDDASRNSIIDRLPEPKSSKDNESKLSSNNDSKLSNDNSKPSADDVKAGENDEANQDDEIDYFDESSDETMGENLIDTAVIAAEIENRQVVNDIILDSAEIRTEEGDEVMSKGINIADLMIRFDHEKLTASVAELLVSNGKSINPKLLEIVEFAINNNPETRESIAKRIPEFIREFPDQISTYQEAVFTVARNIRVKYMLRCPENNNLYESMEGFFDKMEAENPHLAIEYGRGIKKLQEVWLKTDCDGHIVDQDKLLTEVEVRKIIESLPAEMQKETFDKLHIKVVKDDSKPRKKATGSKNHPKN